MQKEVKQMIVEKIEEVCCSKDGQPYWVIHFQDKKLTLTEWDVKPNYAEGDELPFEVTVVKPEQGKWYYKKAATKVGGKPNIPLTKAAFKDDDVIMLQTAFKGAVECEKVWYVPDGKAHCDRVLQNMAELFAGMLLSKPKKKSNELTN
jgi:hypothetical protein